MPQLVQILVVFTHYFAVFAGRNHRFHALMLRLLYNGVAVIPPIRQQVFGSDALDQAASLRAIRCGTFRNKDSDRHTMRIHGQM